MADALTAAGHLEVVVTTHRGHAADLAARAVRRGAEAVVVLGGDGTLNEVAGSVAGTDCALAALPGGSTSVLARSIGLPNNAEAAAGIVADSLRAGHVEEIGLGRVNGRYFALHTGIGWDAALVERVERRPRLKRIAGQLPFVAAGIRTFTGGYDRSRPHFRFTIGEPGRPGTEIIDDAYFTLVMNSDPYTYIGPVPLTVSPAADLHGALSVVTLTSMHMAGFAPLMLDALRSGQGLRERPGVVVRTGVSSASASRLTTMPHQVDGDHLGDAELLEFSHHPRAVRLVVP